MIPTRIFLDLDDVCNTFSPYALNYVGCPIGPTDYNAYDSKFGWDIVRAATELHPSRNFTLESFWYSFNRNAWANVPVSDELPLLLRNCVALVGEKNICILTSPVLSPGCLEGKLDWIQQNLPSWLHRQFLIGPQKYLCAQPGALLIDDAEHNVIAFREHNGRTLLVPRPWNSLRRANTTEHLNNIFQWLFKLKQEHRDRREVLAEPPEPGNLFP